MPESAAYALSFRTYISFGNLPKGSNNFWSCRYQSTFGSLCMQNLHIACNTDHRRKFEFNLKNVGEVKICITACGPSGEGMRPVLKFPDAPHILKKYLYIFWC